MCDLPPHMDAPTRYPVFPQPPLTRARCPKSLPRLRTTPAALTRRNDVGGETPAIPTTTVRNSDGDADRASSNHVVNFSTFLSAGSTVLRVTTTGNHPSPTTAANALLTEIGDVCIFPPLRVRPSVLFDQVLIQPVPRRGRRHCRSPSGR